MNDIARQYVAVEGNPKDRSKIILIRMSTEGVLEGVGLNQTVDMLWPWQDPPIGGWRGEIYQLSSDQQHMLGTEQLWCVFEAQSKGRAPRNHVVFFRTLLPGRGFVVGVNDKRISLMHRDHAAELCRWLATMQTAWGNAYHGDPEQSGASVAPLN